MQTFNEFYGNDLIVTALKKSVLLGRINHAYMFIGAYGTGKRFLASVFLASVLCEKPNQDGACGICKSCLLYASGNHPDLMQLAPEKASLGVEQIRGMVSSVNILPYMGKHRVFIINSAHTLTPQAQNALLKTLEDAPSYAVFLLLAEDGSYILPTIFSRSSTFYINPLPNALVAKKLAESGIPIAEAEVLADFSQGSIGLAKELYEIDFFALRDFSFRIADSIKNMELHQIFSMAKEIELKKDSIHHIFAILLKYYRDILIKNIGNTQSIAKDIGAILKAEQSLGQNANFLLTVELMLLSLKGEIIPPSI